MATQLDPKQLDKLTVSALKAELSARGLLTDGLKNVLVNRLREVLPPAEEEEAHALPQEAPTLPVRDDETPSVQVSLQPTEEEPSSSSSSSSSSASSSVGASSPSSTVENGATSPSRKRSHPEGSERPSKRGCLMTLLPPDLSDQEIRSYAIFPLPFLFFSLKDFSHPSSIFSAFNFQVIWKVMALLNVLPLIVLVPKR